MVREILSANEFNFIIALRRIKPISEETLRDSGFQLRVLRGSAKLLTNKHDLYNKFYLPDTRKYTYHDIFDFFINDVPLSV